MEYDVACDNTRPEIQAKRRELVTYQAAAMGLISSDLSSEMLCGIWDQGLAFAKPVRREIVEGWLSFTEFIPVVWKTGMVVADIASRIP